MFITFDEQALLAILERNYEVKRRTLVAAEPDLLQIARNNCSVPFPGGATRNPAPGNVNGGTGVYRRSGQFARTLQLEVQGEELVFSSPAVSPRKGFAYGQGLIEGWDPFRGPYKLLPPEFYV